MAVNPTDAPPLTPESQESTSPAPADKTAKLRMLLVPLWVTGPGRKIHFIPRTLKTRAHVFGASFIRRLPYSNKAQRADGKWWAALPVWNESHREKLMAAHVPP
ncbi:hypothetical protein VMCG_03148 [Cytospora schulzeri]|uniref:Uncharacterized protein n=1 Tax=Cytospora schulzeri TaxID=448051 RepID=A0A423WY36_9PEZI|nr:hypothetical protein VMCG_03148 [Valsa malicola]